MILLMSIYSIGYVISIDFLLPEFLINQNPPTRFFLGRSILIDSKFEMRDNENRFIVCNIKFSIPCENKH